jgi:predicted transcriptional regulator
VHDSSRAGWLARTDAPRCTLGEKIADIRDRFGDELVCAVVDEHGTVLGAVRKETTQLADTTVVDEVLQPAPPTVRPSITTDELARSMARDGRTYVYVTTVEGTLLGLVTRADLHGQH